MNMNFAASVITALFLTGVRAFDKEICEFCQLSDIAICTTSLEERIVCVSSKESCILGLANNDADNLTDAVCLLKGDSASHQAHSLRLEAVEGKTVSVDGSKDTTLQTFDYSSELGNSFPSGATDKPELSTSSEVNIFECLSCDSLSSDACLGGGDNLEAIKCDMPSECVTVFTDGHLTRNCSSAFSETILDLCRSPDATSCTLCQTPKCNNLPWNQCYKCGAKEGRNCTLTSSIPTEICPNHNDECSVRITKTGDTVRGCSPAGSGCPPEEICSSCVEALCNSGVFPANRLRCIQCVGCEEGQNPSTALPCTRYVAEEKCFTYLTDKEKMIRGCASDIAGMQHCNASAPKCVTCNDRDGCNDMPRLKEPSLSCHNCTSAEDEGCAWGQSSDTLEQCQNKVPFYLQESCMMEYNPETEYAVRGCSIDNWPCSPKDPNCRTCSSKGCNSGNLRFLECIHCKSDEPEQEDCGELEKGMSPRRCPHKWLPYASAGCYTIFKENVTTRGCIIDMEDVHLCGHKKGVQCTMCYTDGCNNFSSRAQECIQCRSDVPNEGSCSDIGDYFPSKTCPSGTEPYSHKTCFTMTKGNVTTRGCFGALAPEDQQICKEKNQYQCQLCTTDGCNTHHAKPQKCIQCRSNASSDSSCSKRAEGIPAKNCPLHMHPFQKGRRGCFTMNIDNVVTRGCLGGLSLEGVDWCKIRENFLCEHCKGDGCNNGLAPNEAAKFIDVSLLAWILPILFVL